jgi:hypothetical protein
VKILPNRFTEAIILKANYDYVNTLRNVITGRTVSKVREFLELSMEHFPLAICDFQTTFLKTRIKATEVSILATSAGHLKY